MIANKNRILLPCFLVKFEVEAKTLKNDTSMIN